MVHFPVALQLRMVKLCGKGNRGSARISCKKQLAERAFDYLFFFCFVEGQVRDCTGEFSAKRAGFICGGG